MFIAYEELDSIAQTTNRMVWCKIRGRGLPSYTARGYEELFQIIPPIIHMIPPPSSLKLVGMKKGIGRGRGLRMKVLTLNDNLDVEDHEKVQRMANSNFEDDEETIISQNFTENGFKENLENESTAPNSDENFSRPTSRLSPQPDNAIPIALIDEGEISPDKSKESSSNSPFEFVNGNISESPRILEEFKFEAEQFIPTTTSDETSNFHTQNFKGEIDLNAETSNVSAAQSSGSHMLSKCENIIVKNISHPPLNQATGNEEHNIDDIGKNCLETLTIGNEERNIAAVGKNCLQTLTIGNENVSKNCLETLTIDKEEHNIANVGKNRLETLTIDKEEHNIADVGKNCIETLTIDKEEHNIADVGKNFLETLSIDKEEHNITDVGKNCLETLTIDKEEPYIADVSENSHETMSESILPASEVPDSLTLAFQRKFPFKKHHDSSESIDFPKLTKGKRESASNAGSSNRNTGAIQKSWNRASSNEKNVKRGKKTKDVTKSDSSNICIKNVPRTLSPHHLSPSSKYYRPRSNPKIFSEKEFPKLGFEPEPISHELKCETNHSNAKPNFKDLTSIFQVSPKNSSTESYSNSCSSSETNDNNDTEFLNNYKVGVLKSLEIRNIANRRCQENLKAFLSEFGEVYKFSLENVKYSLTAHTRIRFQTLKQLDGLISAIMGIPSVQFDPNSSEYDKKECLNIEIFVHD